MRISLNTENLINYIIISIAICIFSYAFSNGIETPELIRESLSKEYSNDIINNYINSKITNQWLNYILIPIIILVKTILIAFFIRITIKLINLNNSYYEEYSLNSYWQMTLYAEWTFIVLGFLKFYWFAFIIDKYSLSDIYTFFPLSLATYFHDVAPWLQYPISLLNIWELIYWIILIFCIKNLHKYTFLKSFEIVIYSYGFPLLIWTCLVMYLILNLS